MPKKTEKESLVRIATRRAAAQSAISLSTALAGFAVGEALDIVSVGNWVYGLLLMTIVGFAARWLQVWGEGLSRGLSKIQ